MANKNQPQTKAQKAQAQAQAKTESEKKYQVKILMHVGSYVPGQIVKCDEEEAANLIHVNEIDNGLGQITRRVRAVLLEDWEAEEAEKNKASNLSMGQADDKGVKNIVGPSAEEIAAANEEIRKAAEARSQKDQAPAPSQSESSPVAPAVDPAPADAPPADDQAGSSAPAGDNDEVDDIEA